MVNLTRILLLTAFLAGLADISAKQTNFWIDNYNHKYVVDLITTLIENYLNEYDYSVLMIRSTSESNYVVPNSIFLDQEVLLKLKPLVKVVIQTKPCPIMSSWQRLRNFWIVDDLNSLQMIISWSSYNSYSPCGKYIILYRGLKDDVLNVFEIMFKCNVISILLILLDKYTRVTLYTSAPYSIASNCSALSVQEVNAQSDILLSKQFPSPEINLNACPLKVVLKHNPPFMTLSKNFSGKYILGGLEGRALLVLADRRNFTMEITEIDTMEHLQNPTDKNLQSGLVTAVVIMGAALGVGGFLPATSFGTNYVSLVNFHVFSDLVIAVPRLPRYGDFVQISLPFTTSSWILITAAFVSLSIFICILGKLKPSLRFAVLGRLSTKPTQNLIVAGLGQSVSRDPEKNFARSLMLFWIVLTFVIRNVYIGKQFDIIRADTNYWAFETYEDLEKSGLPVYVHRQYCDFVKDKQLSIKMICFNGTSKQILDKIRVENFHGAFLTNRMDINYHDLTQQKRDLSSKNILTLRDFKIEMRTLLILPKNSPLKGMFNKDLLDLGGSGLLSKWIRDYITPRINDNPEPFQLTLKNVDAIFQIFTWGMTVAFIVFLMEVIYKRI